MALPSAVGVTPAHAQAQLEITKTHRGDFARGGQGTYIITVSNTGNQPTSGTAGYIDTFPEGFVVRAEGPTVTSSTGVGAHCTFNEEEINCGSETPIPAGGGFTVEVTVLVHTDAPCSLTNTVTAEDATEVDGEDGSAVPVPCTAVAALAAGDGQTRLDAVGQHVRP
ncbi:hypothetical protein [Streptomyces sp. NPDC006463]|uniref:hypothetical protein n=1 Tax=Streptomyces sp. NPDC006463 TaxID=3364746 RepID=UPI0036C151B4